jgi:pimeloyl-ACP methyl ester carboxylesterase
VGDAVRVWLLLCLFAGTLTGALSVREGYADSGGVKIHYAAMGKGPLVVMIHGFPDYWYTWRHQMEALAPSFEVVAIDNRGYNLSDKPKGAESYEMRLLVGDVAAVIRHFGREKAIVVGHDWGGAIAWQVALQRPEMVEKLVILNLPHPNGMARELASNPEQQKNAAYARRFQAEGSEKGLTAEGLARWVKDPEARKLYVEAFGRSDFAAMMAYYQRNYPREPYTAREDPRKVMAPVLQIHGLNDPALLPGGLNGTWQWVAQDWTLVTVPGAGHFVQQDAAELVSKTMKMWLLRD